LLSLGGGDVDKSVTGLRQIKFSAQEKVTDLVSDKIDIMEFGLKMATERAKLTDR